MDAERFLHRMCERHALDPEGASELLPLVQRALISPDDVQRRILAMIEDNLARRAGGDPTATIESLEDDLDEEVLRAVAKTVHAWDPPWRKKTFGTGGDGSVDLSGGDLPEGLGGGL